MTLTGLTGFIGLFIDLTQLSEDVVQGPKTAEPCGLGQVDVLV